jgi:hypothetical protein
VATANTVLESLRSWVDESVPDDELLPQCQTALVSLRIRLRPEMDEDDPRIATAAAALALYRRTLALQLSGGGVVSFKAGDLSIKAAGDPVLLAARIRDDAFADAAALLEGGAFAFQTT